MEDFNLKDDIIKALCDQLRHKSFIVHISSRHDHNIMIVNLYTYVGNIVITDNGAHFYCAYDPSNNHIFVNYNDLNIDEFTMHVECTIKNVF